MLFLFVVLKIDEDNILLDIFIDAVCSSLVCPFGAVD